MSAEDIKAVCELYQLEDNSRNYPRPDFRRVKPKWQSLNRAWNFAFDDANVGLDEAWHIHGLAAASKRRITVPFAFQWPASGVNDRDAHEVLWYETAIIDPRTDEELSAGDRLVLRFGAVDYETRLWLDGAPVGEHTGGHVPFDVDLTDAIAASIDAHKGVGNSAPYMLRVRVRDSPDDLTQPRGKQYWGPKPKDIFYRPSSGIWQSVWLEVLPPSRIADGSGGTVIRATDIETGRIHADVAVLGKYRGYSVELAIGIGDHAFITQRQNVKNTGYAYLSLEPIFCEGARTHPQNEAMARYMNRKNGKNKEIAFWSPEEPFLYTLWLTLYDESGQMVDKVITTIGIRSLDWTSNDATFRLNGVPYFQALVLDQGYWPTSGLTAPTPLHHALDIHAAKSMGFNGCRKHQKVEDPLFLYLADRMGFIVWGEMANAYSFSDRYVERFDAEWRAAVRRDINHPCVFAWTPVNESWGYDALVSNRRQRDHLRAVYFATKTMDPTRPVNENCGWEHVATDLLTFHDYTEAAELKETCSSMTGILGPKSGRPVVVNSKDGGVAGPLLALGAPVICTEFGGVNIRPAEGTDTRSDDWGYHTAEDPDDLLERIRRLMTGIVAGKIVCGFVYTQL
jgi:beta-galactosidase/beta-glucuronidase